MCLLQSYPIGPEEPLAFTPLNTDVMNENGILRTNFCNLDGTRADAN